MTLLRDFCAPIGDAIDLAVDVINRPTLSLRLPAITAAAEAVDQARAAMVEGGTNPIRAEVSMLLEALANVEGERTANNHFRAGEWCMVAGVLLPMVRQNLALALALRSRARPATSEHDFQDRGKR